MTEIIGSMGAGMMGAMFSGKFNKDSQEDVQDFQRDMYLHRYRMQMEDMQKAGLNPILASGATPPGPGSGTGGTTISSPDLVGALSTAAQMKRVEADVETQKAQRFLMGAQAAESITRADQNTQATAESRARVPNVEASTNKLAEEVKKVQQETKSASAKAYQDTQDAARRSLVGPKTWYTDAMEAAARLMSGLKKSLGLLNETPKRESEREAEPPPAPAQPRYKGRSGR